MKYVFPAIFTPDSGLYSVSFPDLPNCATCGDDVSDALFMADDALNALLAYNEAHGISIPAPSDIHSIVCPQGSFVSLVIADTEVYRRAHSDKAVKKTLTLPQWLNEAAEARGVNFSQTLQDALRRQLGIES